MYDPKMMKIEKKEWDRLDKLRNKLSPKGIYYSRPNMSLSDTVRYLLDLLDEINKLNVLTITKRRQGYHWPYEGLVHVEIAEIVEKEEP